MFFSKNDFTIVHEFIAPLFAAPWSRRVGKGVVGVMAILLLFTSIHVLYSWYAAVTIQFHKTATVTTKPMADEVTQAIAALPERHLFGNNQAVVTEGLPMTSLQLRLLGVIKTDPLKFSKVIISEANQPGKVYSKGDSLVSGVTVYEITDDGVVLENGGHFEKLPLLRTPLTFQGAPKPMLENS